MVLKLNHDFFQPPLTLFLPASASHFRNGHPSTSATKIIITATQLVSFASFVSLHRSFWDDNPSFTKLILTTTLVSVTL
jgi:hypothetical protein